MFVLTPENNEQRSIITVGVKCLSPVKMPFVFELTNSFHTIAIDVNVVTGPAERYLKWGGSRTPNAWTQGKF